MAHPRTTTLPDGTRIPATPPGCTPFPALGRYPETWTLHVMILDGEDRTLQAVRGTHASHLNAAAAAAMARGATVYAWCALPAPERCPDCGRLTRATALIPCRCAEAA